MIIWLDMTILELSGARGRVEESPARPARRLRRFEESSFFALLIFYSGKGVWRIKEFYLKK